MPRPPIEATGETILFEIELVGLSTTLATNAIVEGHGGRVCLLLLGYDPDLVQKYGFTRASSNDTNTTNSL